MFGEGALWIPHHILSQTLKKMRGSLGLGETTGPLSNPPNINCYLNSQTGNSTWSFLCREAQRGQFKSQRGIK